MRRWAIAERSSRLIVADPRTRTLNGTTRAAPRLRRTVRGYVRTRVRLHGQGKTAETLGVSRHTLWQFLEQGRARRTLRRPELGRRERRGDQRSHVRAHDRPRGPATGACAALPAPGHREGTPAAGATPLATVEDLSRFGRVPASTLRDWLKKLTERGLVGSVPHHLSVLGTRPKRRYFPTEKGVVAGAMATKGESHMLRSYPVSKQWLRLLAKRLDAVAVLHRVAAMVADADPHGDQVRVDHYRNGPYDMLLTLTGGRSIGVIRQGPTLPTSRLRYHLRSIERLYSSDRPFVTLVLTHADQVTRRAVRSLGDPSEHGRTFVVTEGELLAGDHTGVVWHRCGSGLGLDPTVRLDPDASLAGILTHAEGLLDTSYSFLRGRPKPRPNTLYPSGVQATMPEPTQQLKPALSVQLSRAEKDALDMLAAWPLCTREQLAGLMGGVTLRRVNQVLRSLSQHDLVRSDELLHMLTDDGLTYLARRDRAAVGLTLDRWSAESLYWMPTSTPGLRYALSPPRCDTTPASTSLQPCPRKSPDPRTTTCSTCCPRPAPASATATTGPST